MRKSKRTADCGTISSGSKPRKSLRNSFQEVLKENTGSVKHIESKKAAGEGQRRCAGFKSTTKERSSKKLPLQLKAKAAAVPKGREVPEGMLRERQKSLGQGGFVEP